MAGLTVELDQLVVRLSPLERVAAIRREVRVPIWTVRSVAPEPRPWLALRGRLVPGTGVRGYAAYGVWRWTGDRKDFAAVSRNRPVVRVELDPPSPFARLLVSVRDAGAAAEMVRREARL